MTTSEYAKYDVVLLPTFLQVEAWRKRRALEQSSGLLGPAVTTFNAWIADLWELHGDGRALVDSTQRAMVMRAAFAEIAVSVDADDLEVDLPDVADTAIDDIPLLDAAEHDVLEGEGVLTLSPGIAALAARCEMHAAGVWEYDVAVAVAAEGETPAGCSMREGLFLRGVARYRVLLKELGLVEIGEACRALTEKADEVFPRPMKVLW